MLTETEKRILIAVNESGRPLSGLDSNDPRHRTDLRESMSKTAYHEAGHFAARCFTQHELSHVVKVSIIPNEHSAGRIISERNFARGHLRDKSSPVSHLSTWHRAQGKMLLLHDLAGYGANVLSDPDGRWDSIYDYYEDNCFDYDGDKGDMSKSRKTANRMAPGYMPASRILRLADRWTLEMLRIPAVWNIVEVTRKRLLEHGELTFDELEDLTWNYEESIIGKPRWLRRVFKELAEKRPGRVAA